MQLGSAEGSSPKGVGLVTSVLPEAGTTARRRMDAVMTRRTSRTRPTLRRRGGRSGGQAARSAAHRAPARPPRGTTVARAAMGSVRARRRTAPTRLAMCTGDGGPRRRTSGPFDGSVQRTMLQGRTCADLLPDRGLIVVMTGSMHLENFPDHMGSEGRADLREPPTPKGRIATELMRATQCGVLTVASCDSVVHPMRSGMGL